MMELIVALATLPAATTVVPVDGAPAVAPVASGLVLRPTEPMPHRFVRQR